MLAFSAKFSQIDSCISSRIFAKEKFCVKFLKLSGFPVNNKKMFKDFSIGQNFVTSGKPDLMLYGYPYDSIFKRDAKPKREGRDYAPDCLRRFFPHLPSTDSPEPKFSSLRPLKDLKIRDLGNYSKPETNVKSRYAMGKTAMSIDEVFDGDLPENLAEFLECDLPLVVISSTKEILYSWLKAVYADKNLADKNLAKVGLLSIGQELGLRKLYNDYN